MADWAVWQRAWLEQGETRPTARLLEIGAGRHRSTRASHGSPAASASQLPRPGSRTVLRRPARPAVTRVGPPARSIHAHGPPGRIRLRLEPLVRTGRLHRRHTGGRPVAARTRIARRLLRQHTRRALANPGSRRVVRIAPAPDPRNCARGPCSPGRAIRADHRGLADRARHQPQSRLPGPLRFAQHAHGNTGARRSAPRLLRVRDGNGAVRFGALSLRRRGSPMGTSPLGHRPLRTIDHGALGRSVHHAPARSRGNTRTSVAPARHDLGGRGVAA